MIPMMKKLNLRRSARAAARGQRGMTLLEIMIVLAIIALVMGFLVGPRVMEMFREGEGKVAQMMVKQVADQAYPQWSLNNPGEDCPSSINDLQKYMNNPKKEIKDPWGQALVMLCGSDAPEGVSTGFAVLSKGKDKKQGTEDDIKSWEN